MLFTFFVSIFLFFMMALDLTMVMGQRGLYNRRCIPINESACLMFGQYKLKKIILNTHSIINEIDSDLFANVTEMNKDLEYAIHELYTL